MNLFDDAVESARFAAKSVSKKAEEVVAFSKKKLEASELKGRLEDQYALLGRLCYESARGGGERREECRAAIETIDSLKLKLEQVNRDASGMRNRIPCPQCGTENTAQAIFCSQCGHRFSR